VILRRVQTRDSGLEKSEEAFVGFHWGVLGSVGIDFGIGWAFHLPVTAQDL
jgi:hypothetical protein